MPSYRVYKLLPNGRLSGALPEIIECDDDQSAIEQARRYLDGAPVEIWDQARLVDRLMPEDRVDLLNTKPFGLT